MVRGYKFIFLLLAKPTYPSQIHEAGFLAPIDVMSGDLVGPDFSLWGSVLSIKEPTSPHYVSWHQDATYMGVTPWIALSPSNLESGCMSMIPGSHRCHIQNHAETFVEDNILTRAQARLTVSQSLTVTTKYLPEAFDNIINPGAS